jgi:O-antigen/teichoic acid export membrane protein
LASLRQKLNEPPAPEISGHQPLRHLAVRGGAYLVGREAVGMFIRRAGVVATVRLIGPHDYGIYAAAAAFTLVVTTVAQMGAEVFLIKMPETPSRERYDQVFTFLICTSLIATAVALGATLALGGLLRPVGVLLPLQILLLSVPINVLWAPAQARIERNFGYRKMGVLEVGGDLALYGTAVPLAFLGAGAWSLIAGYFAWQTWLLVGSYALSGLRPRLRWSSGTARELTRYGFSFSMTSWIQRLSGLVNPLVVGGFFGAVGVGYVAFAQRLVDTVSFANRGAYRIGMVAMARVPVAHRDRIERALEEGSVLQLVALGIPLAAFGVIAPKVIPLLFGSQWDASIRLYSLLALASLLGASGLIQTTFLLSRGRNGTVAWTAAIGGVVLAASSVPLVWRFGIEGFGYATLLALVDLVFLDLKVRQQAAISYRRYLPLAATMAPLVAFPLVPFPISLVMFAPAIAFLIVPNTRRQGFQQVKVVRAALSRRTMEEAPA